MDPIPPRFRPPRFTLRAVLVTIALASVMFAWGAAARQQHQRASALAQMNPGVRIVYDDELREPGRLRSWIAGVLGHDYTSRVVAVELFYPTDKELQLVGQFGALEQLRLERAVDVTAAGLAPLARLSSLRSLTLDDGWSLDDAAIEALARLQSLEELTLDTGPRVTSDGLLKLAALKRLKRLNLDGPDAQDIERLRALLPGCPVNDRHPSDG